MPNSFIGLQYKMEDNYRHAGLRKKLTELLVQKGISNQEILGAIATIPRHLFLDKAFVEAAYEDKAFQIGEGQTISQPYTVAFQTQLLNVERNHKVLEVGTGSGYQASVLSYLGARIFTIERQKKLHDKTKPLLNKLGFKNIKFFFGDGYLGLPAYAPFDRIIVTAGAPYIPEELIKQLKVDGLLVIPIDDQNGQKMKRIIKISDTEIKTEDHGDFAFVPMLQGKNW